MFDEQFSNIKKWPLRYPWILGILIGILILLVIMFMYKFVIPLFEGPPQQASCQPLPESFKETDLIGLWEAKYFGGLATDSIILREDGKYKQKFREKETGFYYEGEWLPWWIEYRDSGYARLHLEGMRRCDGLLSICQQEEGGTDEWTIDYCEDIHVDMIKEVVLIVTGDLDTDNLIRGIELKQTRLAGSDWTYTFRLQDE